MKKCVHENAISALAVSDRLVITGASDSLVKVWTFSSEKGSGVFIVSPLQTDLTDNISEDIAEVQSIPFKRYPLSVAVTQLPDSEGK